MYVNILSIRFFKQTTRRLVVLLIGITLCSNLTAQTVNDALRFSATEVFGTARSTALGGAMGALGADFGTLGVNPAGLGAYRSSEFIISGVVLSQSTSAQLIDGGIPASEDKNTRFTISNIGIVFASQPRNQTWKASNFAVGYNKTGDYNMSFNYSGRNLGSITDRFSQNAFGFQPNELNAFEEALAYETGAIYDPDGDLFYETDYQLSPNSEILRRQTVTRSGGNGEIVLAYGANYNEKLLFGMTLGIPIVSYDETKDYEEEDSPTDPIPFFNALRFEETLSTSGNGINVKLGATYKISRFFNIGAAYHTRTRYSLSDNFSTRLTYDYTINSDRFVFTSPVGGPQEGAFDYSFRTPWSVIGNLSYLITTKASDDKGKSKSKKKKSGGTSMSRGKKKKTKSTKDEAAPRNFLGFIVAHIEYKDFSKARFDYSRGDNGDDFQFAEDLVNGQISNSLSSALDIRLGAEYMIKKVRVRGGINMTQSPYAGDNSFATGYSLGAGYRFKRIFLDFAYQHKKSDLVYSPYSVAYAPISVVNNNTKFNRFVFTVGYKWL